MIETNFKKNNAFTLVELMISVGIIAILVGLSLAVINPGGVRSKARDSQRISDLKRIQTALELYFAEYRRYPVQQSNSTAQSALTYDPSGAAIPVVPTFLSTTPVDPKGGSSGVNCFGSSPANYNYYYRSNSVTVGSETFATKYVLGALMEVPTSAASSVCSSLTNCSGSTPPVSCSCSATNCYGVQNPL